jgi:hypothetical protein
MRDIIKTCQNYCLASKKMALGAYKQLKICAFKGLDAICEAKNPRNHQGRKWGGGAVQNAERSQDKCTNMLQGLSAN